MHFTGYELLWLFFVYSFFGWVLETAGTAARQRRFVNRGLVNGPLCVIYGITAIVITLSGEELSLFWLFVGSAVLATVVEWIGPPPKTADCDAQLRKSLPAYMLPKVWLPVERMPVNQNGKCDLQALKEMLQNG